MKWDWTKIACVRKTHIWDFRKIKRESSAIGKNEIVLFENQGVQLEVNGKDDTVWLNQDQISRLYGRDRTVILKHIKNALDEELRGVTSTCAKFAQAQTEENRKVKREIEYYNLDVIISIGYRVKSSQGMRYGPNKKYQKMPSNHI